MCKCRHGINEAIILLNCSWSVSCQVAHDRYTKCNIFKFLLNPNESCYYTTGACAYPHLNTAYLCNVTSQYSCAVRTMRTTKRDNHNVIQSPHILKVMCTHTNESSACAVEQACCNNFKSPLWMGINRCQTNVMSLELKIVRALPSHI